MPFPRFVTPVAAAAGSGQAPIPPAGSGNGQSTDLSFTIQSQQEANWCWAAVTASVIDFYRTKAGTAQCEIANAALSRNDCCTAAGSDPNKCNTPFYLETALDVTGHLAAVMPRPLTLPEVQSEITRSRPIGCRVEWHDGSGHFLAIIGFSLGASGLNYLHVADPIFLDSQIPFHDFATLYQTGASWTHSYLTLRAAAGGALMAVSQPRPPQHQDAIGA